jgi:hypothetical protein
LSTPTLAGLTVDHPPRHRPLQNLAKRLGCLEAVAGRQPHPPLGDLLRPQLADLSIAEHRRRVAEQVAELLDRHRLHIVLSQVRLDELGEREPPRDPPLLSKPLQLALERLACVLLGGEPTPLHTLRVAAAGPEAVRPEPLAARPATREFDYLSMLHHR